MTGDEAGRLIDSEWQAFTASFTGLDDDEMMEAGVVGDWSVKELLAHVAFWDGVAAQNLDLAASGRSAEIVRPRTRDETDAWNERERRQRRAQSLRQAREESAASHQRMLTALAALPDARFSGRAPDRRLWRLLAEDTFEHYREHRGHVEAWLRRVQTSEI